jgi:hypothetical protein
VQGAASGFTGRYAIERIKDDHDLRAVVERYTLLKKWSRQEWAGPCPRCGGTDRFHVHASGWWKCYQCHPQRADVIEFVRWAGRCDFATACQRLGGLPLTIAPQPARAGTPRRQPRSWTTLAWRAVAEGEVAAAATLLDSPEGSAGWRYLAERGILPVTWRAWGLGLASPWHPRLRGCRPAIVMPWRHCGWLQAVTYRFIPWRGVTLDKANRFSQRAGGERTVYGSELLGDHFKTLILVEGELNAVSVWQALRQAEIDDVDVLSFGSEGNAAGRAAVEMAQGYQQVIAWTDREERAAQALQSLEDRARGLQSPRGMDANDLLRAGVLGDFLQAMLEIEAEGGPSTEAPPTSPVVESGFVPAPLTEDPRPDLVSDSALWAALLEMACTADGENPDGYFGALYGIRCCGAQMDVLPTGGWRIRRGEISEDEWIDIRQRWLLPHEAAIRRLLRGSHALQGGTD